MRNNYHAISFSIYAQNSLLMLKIYAAQNKSPQDSMNCPAVNRRYPAYQISRTRKCTDVFTGALLFRIPFRRPATWYRSYQTETLYHTDFGHRSRGLRTSRSVHPVKRVWCDWLYPDRFEINKIFIGNGFGNRGVAHSKCRRHCPQIHSFRQNNLGSIHP